MTSTQKWATPLTIATALTSEFNSLASGSLTAASSAIDNLTDLYQYMGLELVLASLTPVAPNNVEIYLFKSIDDTNYEDVSATLSQCLVAVIPVTTGTGAKRSAVSNILIPPFKFKLVAKNNTGVGLAASGNTLSIRRYYEQSA